MPDNDASASSVQGGGTDSIALDSVTKFLKHHLHDVRNELNALNLEATLLSVLVTDPDALQSAQRIQDVLHQSAARLGALSLKLSDPSPTLDVVPAQFIVTSWKDELAASRCDTKVEWKVQAGEPSMRVDVRHLAEIFRELLSNVKTHGTNRATVEMEIAGGEVVFRVVEPDSAEVNPTEWGQQPFENPRRGSYGLGLWRTRRLVDANRGQWSQTFTAGSGLVSEIRFPEVMAS